MPIAGIPRKLGQQRKVLRARARRHVKSRPRELHQKLDGSFGLPNITLAEATSRCYISLLSFPISHLPSLPPQ
jgi:hypothetical protein